MDAALAFFAPALLLGGAGLAAAGLLAWANGRLPLDEEELVRQIERRLPQIQCGQCGYPGCRPYAEALAAGEAASNRCPPGGQATANALAELLGQERRALDPAFGVEGPRLLAVIDEQACIGCARCIEACPVDAIVGAAGFMHTVLDAVCTGCDLCREPCPVDCIELAAHPAQPVAAAMPEAVGVCIDCGLCEPACPKGLAPQLLYRWREAPAMAAALRLNDCIECGQCDRACPSALPLTRSFQASKRLVRAGEAERHEAEAAERRYAQREARLSARETALATRPSADEVASLLAAARSSE